MTWKVERSEKSESVF